MKAQGVYQVNSEALENCAKEPIHQTPLIQSYGFLIACDRDSGTIEFVSENARDFLASHGESLLGQSLCALVENPVHEVMQWLGCAMPGAPSTIGLRFLGRTASSQHFEVLAHRVGQRVVVEAMPFETAPNLLEEHMQAEELVRVLGELHHQKSLPEFLEACALEIRRVAQYQRVIIYRFLPDWSGEVIAESCEGGIAQRFIGLRFPASDIPAQARALYRSNLLRIIGDVQASPVALQSADTHDVLDQSHSLLRSPSPMHLGYLHNMGVRATMTISLLKDGELWGMVSCHHPVPKAPPTQLRRMTKLLCALVAQTAVTRIDALRKHESMQSELRIQSAIAKLRATLMAPGDFSALAQKALDELAVELNFQAHGILIAGNWLTRPDVPATLLDFLVGRARSLESDAADFSHQLTQDRLDQERWQPWAGAAVLRISDQPGHYLILLRQAAVRQIRWAGAPSVQTEVVPSGMRVLGPRQSFESWTQLVHGQSERWADAEQQACAKVASTLAQAYQSNNQRQMESELRLLGSCMAHLNDMVLVTDATSLDEPGPRIVFVNEAFTQFTGFSREEVLGRSPRFLQGSQTQRPALDAMRRAMRSWSRVTVELINYKKSGEPYWAEISLAPIVDSKGWHTHWIAIERDIDERKRAELDIQKLVYYDSLTALPNRRLLMDRLRVALSNSRRYGRNAALMFVDLDNFKEINDTAGHHVGDELLRQVAMRLVAEVRVEDTVARLGGDEFVVMVEGLSGDPDEAAAAAQLVAEKLIAGLSRNFEFTGSNFHSTASLGISLFCENDSEPTAEDLLKQADFAMYQAKMAGRNTWRFYDPVTQATQIKRNALEADLRTAWTTRLLEVHYQPIVNRDQHLTGVEALLRWNHPVRGWVSPAEFIPIAERNGLIVEMGMWVIESACALLSRWQSDARRAGWTIAVNVSAKQMRTAEFVAQVQAVVAAHGCPASQLKLELTESLLLQDLDATIEKMRQLGALGIQFSIDDFGTGYSSLTYLRRLPISVLKIDRSFVQDIELDEGDKAICQTILALGNTLHLDIVAEGVETVEQFTFLHQGGCDRFQGFLFSRALSLQALEAIYA